MNAYEYYQSYKNLGTDSSAYGNGYLNIGYYWWLITPTSGSTVWLVSNNGTLDYKSPSSLAYGVRPSVNLKSDIKISGGEGTKENPYRISGDKEVAKVNDKLNSRISGEYVNFDGKKYRIVGIENETTKLTSVDYVRDSGNTVMTKNFGSNANWGTSVTSDSDDSYWSYYLNNTWYNSISTIYKSMLEEGTYYLGTVYEDSTGSYKNAICSASNTTEPTSECSKTSSTWKGKVGLPRVGEMFSAMLGNGYTDTTEHIWLLTPHSSSYVTLVISYGNLNWWLSSNGLSGVRPSINLKSDVVITGGEGTEQKPYDIKYVAPPGVDTIKKTMGQTGGIIGVTTSNTKVTQDGSNIREYRYSGTGVKNYVKFNNELWRIIGIFKDEAGQEHMKIVRDEVLPTSAMPDTYVASGKTFKIRYSSSEAASFWDYDGSAYDNNWADAGLMNWLNSTGTTNGYLKTLSTTAQGMI